MIAAHPPDALNLVLVDFKGGATFLGLERAPHVAAVITNLADEAHLVARMKDALAGEMNRRQELLEGRGQFRQCRRVSTGRAPEGRGLAPLPALFIVVDEFSELLSQHPDFADLFIAIGRLGARWACTSCSPANGSTRAGCAGWSPTCPIGSV